MRVFGDPGVHSLRKIREANLFLPGVLLGFLYYGKDDGIIFLPGCCLTTSGRYFKQPRMLLSVYV